MKSLKLITPFIVFFTTQIVFAQNAFETYRQGNYINAANQLNNNEYLKNPLANYYLGKMYLYGYGELKNTNLGLRYLKKSAQMEYLPAQNLMARFALLEEHDFTQALQWFKKAADKGDLSAQMYTAAAYTYGLGTKINKDLARKYHILAAKQANASAQLALAESFLDSKQAANKKLGLIWLNKAVEQGNTNAQLKLAELYSTGKLMNKDIEKARDLLKTHIEKGNVEALFLLGEIARNSHDFITAKDWYTKAAEKNHIKSQLALANLYMQKDSQFFDTKTGFLWMLKAAENNSKDAQLNLAKLYQEGTIIPKDENLASQWNQRAKSNQNDNVKLTKNQVALWLSEGKSIKFEDSGYKLTGILSPWKNKMALRDNIYNQSPEMNVVDKKQVIQPKFVMVEPNSIAISEYYDAIASTLAKTNSALDFPAYPITKVIDVNAYANSYTSTIPPIGIMTNDDATNINQYAESKKQDESLKKEVKTLVLGSKEELEALHLQAALGNAYAQFSLAQRYQNGIGTKKNVDEAIKYYTLASLQKDLRAEYALGVLYLKQAEYQQAFVWLNEAAFKGNPYAQFALGKINEDGYKDNAGNIVVRPNKDQAKAMYLLASSNDFGPAQFNLAEILVRTKPENLTQAAKSERNELIKNLYQGALTSGIKEAALPLAFFKASDIKKEQQEEAFKLASEEAKNGNGNASLLMGLLYDRGIGVNQSQNDALTWYKKAPVNSVSSFILGTYYYQGNGLSQNANKSMELLADAAQNGFSYAGLNLAIAKHNNNENFLNDLEQAVAQGNSKAGLLIADYYLTLANDNEKMRDAFNIYKRFAEQGDRDAQTKLGFMFEQGLGVETNIGNANTWYVLAALQDQNIAQYLLGRLNQLGKIDNNPNYIEAKKWYEKSATKFSPAAVALGFIYDTVEDNYDLAKYYYQVAASQQNPLGSFNLGLMYEQGKGLDSDPSVAMKLYLTAANANNAKAMVQLAGLYFSGLGGAHDEQQAIHWYKKAQALGDMEAFYQLGLLSETGVGLDLNYKQALEYYDLAQNKGNAKAMLALARMYQYGLGVHKNNEQAEIYYRKLSNLNHPYAQYQLATYFSNVANADSSKQTKNLLEAAEQNGSPQAKKMLQLLSSKSDNNKMSYLEPIVVKPIMVKKSADRMYMDALSMWNNGDETQSLMILDQIRTKYPKFEPAKRVYEQLNQQIQKSVTAFNEILGSQAFNASH